MPRRLRTQPSCTRTSAEKAGITTGPLAAIAGVDLEYVGYGIVLLFVVTWALAVTIWKVGRIDERWSAHLSRSGG